jgi:hypothetical protein
MIISGPLTYAGPITTISFSGGVSEYIYALDSQDYGDLFTFRWPAAWSISAPPSSALRNTRSSFPAAPYSSRGQVCCRSSIFRSSPPVCRRS